MIHSDESCIVPWKHCIHGQIHSKIRFISDLLHCLWIVYRCSSDMEECRNLRFQVVKDMRLNASFLLAELCPLEHGQAERNRGWIKCINISFQLEDVCCTFLASLFHHEEGKVFKDPVITILIGCGKCRFRYWITPHAKVVTLGLVSLQRNNNIARLSRLQSCPNMSAMSWFQHVKLFTYLSPSYLRTR